MDDGAAVRIGDEWLVMTTDSHVIQPPFFPGGDIGRLAVCGTVNDLAVSGPHDPFDGAILEYRNPQDGGPTTATMNCRIQLLGPGEQTQAHRHTCNTVYHVLRGQGVAKIGKSRALESELTWTDKDCFNVPTWQWHRFVNSSAAEDAILFSVSDRPLFDALQLYREES
jgi:gentisate 1,2-dioxygenase